MVPYATHTPKKQRRGRGINMNWATKGGSRHRRWRERNGSVDCGLPVNQAHGAKHPHASWPEVREQNIGGWRVVSSSRSKGHACSWVVSEHSFRSPLHMYQSSRGNRYPNSLGQLHTILSFSPRLPHTVIKGPQKPLATHPIL